MLESGSESSSLPVSLLSEEDEKSKRSLIFFCINPSSGSGGGRQLLQASINQMILSSPEPVEIIMCDIHEGETGNKKCFQYLSTTISSRKQQLIDMGHKSFNLNLQFRIICVGGDGTIIWCIQELIKHRIELSNISLGALPGGTANDFARVFGWKNVSLNNFISKSMKKFKKVISLALNSEMWKHDLWEITVEIYPEGNFSKIDSSSRQKHILKNPSNNENVTYLSLLMGNYFSIGIESRIGRAMERNRTKSRNLNKLNYVIHGIRNFFKKNSRIDQIIDEMREEKENSEVIFSSQKSCHPCLRKTMTLLASNIPSFSAGNDIWASTRKVGLKFPDKEKSRKSELIELSQKTGDRKLEFLTFSRTSDLGLEFLFKGQGKRIHQGSGPWIINFSKIKPQTSVYFQVDGEYFRMFQPKFISIKHYCQFSVMHPMCDQTPLASPKQSPS